MVAQPAPEQSDRLRMSVDEWRARVLLEAGDLEALRHVLGSDDREAE
jgi:hypothetical protein